jgi:L-alanine-DL-glutamate epimerase-like enolase superfamily enzyme
LALSASLVPKNNFLVCALDIAGWDLFGKLRNKKLYELWGGDIKKSLDRLYHRY